MPDFKTFFETPKKAALSVACLLVMLATLAAVCVLTVNAFTQGGAPDESPGPSGTSLEPDVPEQSPEGETSQSEFGYMAPSKTMEEAREIALADAGLTASGAVFTGEGLKVDNGLWVYHFYFQSGGTRYEYEVNANTGLVYSKIIERYAAPVSESASQSTPSQAPAAQPTASAPPAYTHRPDGHDSGSGQHYEDHRTETAAGGVDLEEAKAAALADAGLSVGDVTFTKTVTDYEDGLQVYEIEFFTATHEYEYEIDAFTGAVYSRNIEAFQTASAGTNPGMDTGSAYIGVAQAKSIALDHAGLTASQVMVTKETMDRDDGRMVYEIEFRCNGAEYEYKIDAQSGAILEHEVERD